MSALRAITLAASIELGYAYMHYERGGWKQWILLVIFAVFVVAYVHLTQPREEPE